MKEGNNPPPELLLVMLPEQNTVSVVTNYRPLRERLHMAFEVLTGQDMQATVGKLRIINFSKEKPKREPAV